MLKKELATFRTHEKISGIWILFQGKILTCSFRM